LRQRNGNERVDLWVAKRHGLRAEDVGVRVDEDERLLANADDDDGVFRLDVSLDVLEDSSARSQSVSSGNREEGGKNGPNPFFRRLGETVEQSTGNAAIVDNALNDLRLGLPFTHPLVGLENEGRTKDDAGAVLSKKRMC
jgi:hypothetical protein